MNLQHDQSEFEPELIDALARLERGESIEAILRRHPAASVALRPALETAAALAVAVRPPTPEQTTASRDRLLAAFDARFPKSTATPHPVPAVRRLWPAAARSGADARRSMRGLKTAWAIAASVAAIIVFASVAQAASRALPGDPLYVIKEAGRNALVASTLRPEARRDRAGAISAARRSDVALAMLDQRSADVQFEGVIDAYADTWCEVSGILISVPPDVAEYGDSEHPGALLVGDHVQVRARMIAGRLVATAMVPYHGYGSPAPTVPHAPQDSTPSPRSSPPPSATFLPSISPTPSATAGAPLLPPVSGSGGPADDDDGDDDREEDDREDGDDEDDGEDDREEDDREDGDDEDDGEDDREDDDREDGDDGDDGDDDREDDDREDGDDDDGDDDREDDDREDDDRGDRDGDDDREDDDRDDRDDDDDQEEGPDRDDD